MRIETDSAVRQLIENAQTIAVVGLSPKEHRDSYRVAKYLQEQGFQIIPVNPNATEILGEKSYPSLEEIDQPVDLVDVFRRSEFTPEIVRQAVESGAGGVWFQIGIVNDEAAEIATEGGLPIVMDRCLMVDHGRLFR